MRESLSPLAPSCTRPVQSRERRVVLQRFLLPLFLFALVPFSAQAQPFPRVRLDSLDPPGAKRGTSVDVTLAGLYLDEIAALQFSDPHLKAERLPDPPPPKGKGKAPPAPVRFRITVTPDAPLGNQDVRVIGKWGISNPRTFVVGDLPEVQEKEPNNDTLQAQKVELNTTVNGNIANRTDVDYYAFAGKKGQHVLIHCAGSSIDSKLNPLIELLSPEERSLGSNRNYRQRNALLDADLPADGTYLVRVCHFTYTYGKADESFYRLRISTTPWIDAVFPPAVQKGKASTVTLYGRNLPGASPETTTVTINPAATPNDRLPPFFGMRLPRVGTGDLFEYRLQNGGSVSNPALLALSEYPVVLEADSKEMDAIQDVKTPCTVCGRLEGKRDRDWYAFTATKGDVYILEGFADRIGTPIDMYFKLRRADTKQIIQEADANPELPTKAGQFWTYSDDPKLRFVVPADGKYELLVGSWTATDRASERLCYCVEIHKERPDYTLFLIDTDDSGGGITLHLGGHQDLKVVCLRHDGFDGEILLEAEGLPAGVTCEPQIVGPGVKESSLVLSAAAGAANWAGAIRVKGTAQINDAKQVREAVSSTLVWPLPQKNIPAMSRLSRSLCLAVRTKGPFTLGTAPRTLSLPAGGRGEVKLTVNRQWPEFKNATVQITRIAAPALTNGQPINIPNLNIAGGKGDGTVKFQVPTNTKPGTYNLVFQGKGKFSYQLDPKNKQKKNYDATEVTPPIRFVVYNTVADLQVAKPQVVARPDSTVPVVIQVNRLHDYKGDFKVDVVTPGGVQGVSVTATNVPANANQTQVLLKVAKTAKPITNANFLVRATANVAGVNLKQETSFRLTVSKTLPTNGSVSFENTKLLAEGSAGWKYQSAANVKGDWKSDKFNDAGWTAGKTPLGYGEPEVTTRKGTTLTLTGQDVYCRRTFEVPADVLQKKGVVFRLMVAADNSAVVYINGQPADTDPNDDHEFSYWNRDVTIPAKMLRAGKNLIAVHVKNTAGSSDLYLDLAITAAVPKPTAKK